jgi:hypothetical protein
VCQAYRSREEVRKCRNFQRFPRTARSSSCTRNQSDFCRGSDLWTRRVHPARDVPLGKELSAVVGAENVNFIAFQAFLPAGATTAFSSRRRDPNRTSDNVRILPPSECLKMPRRSPISTA